MNTPLLGVKHALPVFRERQAARLERLARDDARPGLDAPLVASLEAALRRDLDGEVRFDRGTRALYATDGSNYRQAPIGVVIPRHARDVEATVRAARDHDVPVLSRGGGTSLAGQCCNVAVVMDFSKYMHGVVAIDAAQRLARVEPGCVLDRLQDAAKSEADLRFGPDPATHSRCTLGGMLGNNSCGSHSLLSKNHGFGLRTSDNTHALEVLLYDGARFGVGATAPDELDAIIAGGGRRGEIYAALKAFVDRHGETVRRTFPRLERRVSGYNLDALLPENGFHVARALVGSESTLVTILEATLHLVPAPAARTVVMLGFESIDVAAECGLEVLSFEPVACESIDRLLFDYVRQKGDESASLALLPRGHAFLLVEFAGASREESDALARRMLEHVKTLGGAAPVDSKLYDDPKQEEMIWAVREGGLGSTAWVPGQPDSWPGWEDSAVPSARMPEYVRELRALFDEFEYKPALYGHLAQGCVHCRVGFDLYSATGIEKYRRFADRAADLVAKFGGVASGEHGDGQARAELLPRFFGPEIMQAFVEFKRIWDPRNRMNAGKLVDLDHAPLGMTDKLRLGRDYEPPEADTHFRYPNDRGSFARAALRCVGVGVCRREHGGTMCPSYRVTRDEQHSTRGRARMLFEMMNGELVEDGWKSEAVKDALDLCLSCKGCKGDCPVNVDMATYKSEFLSHYYAGRLRPRHAYAFGWIHGWARLFTLAPTLVNLVTRLPLLGALAKFLGGVDRRRRIPAFAPVRFKTWFRGHAPRNPDGPRVVLFPDTFTDFFQPDVAVAATRVLEAAGFRVIVPDEDVCCGRPLYDYGFLERAKRRWLGVLRVLQPYYQDDVPIVVLEPSCWAAFKDELTNLMPNDEDAKRLQKNTLSLSEFLRSRASGYAPPALERRALVQGHCHQKALDTLNDKEIGQLFAEKALYDALGLDHHELDAGCCGMAGAFGYERSNAHYDVSVACGERALLPAVRRAADETIVIADGFSCREQIEQQTDRVALHTAQVLELALSERGAPAGEGRPEAATVARRRRARRVAFARAALVAGAGAAVALFGARRLQERRFFA
ncbi:MAG TPA: FAD-binding and (Fe-S)-binding domain-containing protein [Polyangiaceae bacterium]|nr:FAD-binding and (Fe-S)-binding domain-containing protein [Polyangiaceae bacterium]